MNEQLPNASFYIDGYTDNVGSASRNKALSKARAQSVANALIKDGVSKSRLVVRGFGKEHPICTNATEDGRQCNRRVEVMIRKIDQPQQQSGLPVK
jgi:outer membrane protein OmpA-like peptidoglycan-associated protein